MSSSKMLNSNRQIYLNRAQLECYSVAAHSTFMVCGRRFGKTHGVGAPWLIRNVQYLPRSSGGIVCSTFQQALTRTLPGTIVAFESMGYKRNIHFYVGQKPPVSANFPKPVREPLSYDRVISWYTGAVQYLISQDIPGSSNSLTLQYVYGDEAKLLNFDKLKDETFPANGGYPGEWRDSPWLNSMLFMTDMPSSKKGSWILNYKDSATEEIIDAIKVCLSEIARLAAMPASSYTEKQLRFYRASLSELRRNAVYYREFSSIENVALLGEKYIRQMKRDLPPLVFHTSVLCIRPGRMKDGFYPGLSDFHTYTNFNNGYLESLGLEKDVESLDCRQDGDLQSGKPICIAFDYNANINWLVAGQVDGMKLRTLRSFFVKYNRKLRELVDDFCDYYRYHDTKEIIYYYDTTALSSNYALNEDDFASAITSQFIHNGWQVTHKYIGNPPSHSEKYLIIDQGFKGQGGYLMPLFNEHNNEALLMAMRLAGVRVGYKGWQKDKSGEKYAESEEDKLEYRTDGTDAWDMLYYGVNIHPYSGMIVFAGSCVM